MTKYFMQGDAAMPVPEQKDTDCIVCDSTGFILEVVGMCKMKATICKKCDGEGKIPLSDDFK